MRHFETSVIMPVFNSQQYAAQAIESVLSQTYSDFEFLIIDDGSDDSSVEIIKSYKDDRIRFFKREHQGISAQLNFGIKSAGGMYIARMDADDISVNTRLQRQTDFLKTHRQYQIVGSNIQCIDENEGIIRRKRFPEGHDEVAFQMPLIQSVCHPALMCLSSVLKDNLYSEKYPYSEDLELFLRLIEKGYRFHNLQEYLYLYRIVEGRNSIRAIQKSNCYELGLTHISKIHPASMNRKEMYVLNYKLGILEYYMGSVSKARRHFVRAFTCSPGKIPKILRYLIVTFIGNNIVQYLRQKGVLSFINQKIYRLFRTDMQEIRY